MQIADLAEALSDPEVAAKALDAVAAKSGDARYRRAAGFLRGKPGGRPKRNDEEALARMALMLEHGFERTVRKAATNVAQTLGGQQSAESATSRLLIKFRQKQKSENI